MLNKQQAATEISTQQQLRLQLLQDGLKPFPEEDDPTTMNNQPLPVAPKSQKAD